MLIIGIIDSHWPSLSVMHDLVCKINNEEYSFSRLYVIYWTLNLFNATFWHMLPCYAWMKLTKMKLHMVVSNLMHSKWIHVPYL